MEFLLLIVVAGLYYIIYLTAVMYSEKNSSIAYNHLCHFVCNNWYHLYLYRRQL
ncbi:Uncharacterised protein [Staphylococcus aureus]|nr:Uncharacterised protein [Staphylococcus aureus]SBD51050.1 Uncharacterised protein [Staphylococcus aureus]